MIGDDLEVEPSNLLNGKIFSGTKKEVKEEQDDGKLYAGGLTRKEWSYAVKTQLIK